MVKRIFHNFTKGFGGQFIRLGLGVTMSLIVALVSLVYTNGFIVTDWLSFISVWFGIAFLFVVIFQIIGYFLLWISKQISLLEISPVENTAFQCSIEIKNCYEKDITDLQIELKRLTIIGYRVDCDIRHVDQFFRIGKRIEDGKIRKGTTATIRIAEIPENEDFSKFFVDFLTTPVWRGNYLYRNITKEEDEKKNGELAGIVYEFVIEITAKVDNDYISPLLYRGRIRFLTLNDKKHSWQPGIHWIRLDRYSMKKEKNVPKWKPDDEVVNDRKSFWRLFNKMDKK